MSHDHEFMMDALFVEEWAYVVPIQRQAHAMSVYQYMSLFGPPDSRRGQAREGGPGHVGGRGREVGGLSSRACMHVHVARACPEAGIPARSRALGMQVAGGRGLALELQDLRGGMRGEGCSCACDDALRRHALRSEWPFIIFSRVGECGCVCVRENFECVPNAYASVNAPAMLTLICHNVI